MATTLGSRDRLAQELHHHVERLVGMVDDDVLLADGGEAIAAELADALGKADVERLEDQIRPVRPTISSEVLVRPIMPSLTNTASSRISSSLHDETLQSGSASVRRSRGG